MKKLLVASILLSLIACNSSKSGRPDKIQRDTFLINAVFLSPSTNTVEPGVIKRLIWDSLMYVYADTLTNNSREWRNDTSYLVPAYFTLDSLSSKRFNSPIYDSAGNKIRYMQPVEINKKFVMSGWEGIDSISLLKITRK